MMRELHRLGHTSYFLIGSFIVEIDGKYFLNLKEQESKKDFMFLCM